MLARFRIRCGLTRHRFGNRFGEPSVTTTVRPPRIATLLILAFLTMLLAPARMSWACPDGTPCVASTREVFECESGQCATRKSCCEVSLVARCRHGAFPQLDQSRHPDPALQGQDHCRFSVSAAPHVTAVTPAAASIQWLACDVLPASPAFKLAMPAGTPVWRSEFTLGYRPPPIRSTGPSRAPPVA